MTGHRALLLFICIPFFSFFSSPVAAVMWQVDTARGATDPRSGRGRGNHSVEPRWSTVGYGQVTSISRACSPVLRCLCVVRCFPARSQCAAGLNGSLMDVGGSFTALTDASGPWRAPHCRCALQTATPRLIPTTVIERGPLYTPGQRRQPYRRDRGVLKLCCCC